MILTGMPAVVKMLDGGSKAPQILIAAQCHGIYTCRVMKSQFLTGNINHSLMVTHAMLQHSDLINRYHTAKPRGK